MSFLLVRSSDLVLLGVDWTGMSVSAPNPGQPATLTAGASALLILTFPPQHVEEESSAPGSPPPLTLASAVGGVPGWRAQLSASSRLTVSVQAGTAIPLTVEGILAAVADQPLLVNDPPGPQDTALTVPSRLTVIPQSPTSAPVVLRHPVTATDGAAALWRTRLSRSDSATDGDIVVTATASDPQSKYPANYSVPLGFDQQSDIVNVTKTTPAPVRRLDLSALGATLDVIGIWGTFEWEHHCVLGRDITVRTVSKGALYPFGHQARLVQTTSRRFDPAAGGAAVLRTETTILVTEPIRNASANDGARRGFPFTQVELLTTVVTGLPDPDLIGWTSFSFNGSAQPTYWAVVDTARRPVGFSARLGNAADDVHAVLPMIFVKDLTSEGVDSLDDGGLAAALSGVYGTVDVAVPGRAVNLVDASAASAPAATPTPTDVYELQQISLTGFPEIPVPGDGYRAAVSGMQVATPALRALLDDATARPMIFAPSYLAGAASDVLLVIPDQAQQIDVNFTKMTDRCGALMAPRYVADAISRTAGPVNQAAQALAASGQKIARTLFSADATILGYSMRDVLADIPQGPHITATLDSGSAPLVTMTWPAVPLSTVDGFVGAGATADLTVTTGPAGTTTQCTISNFTLQFPPGDNQVLALSFKTVTYNQTNGGPPRLSVTGVSAQFTGDLTLVQMLADVVGDALGPLGVGVGPLVQPTRDGISVQYLYAAPPVQAAVFLLRNIAFSTVITVPFTGDSPTVQVGFSSKTNPFQLTVLMLGGSGYVDVVVDHTGIVRFDAALEFGAMAAVDFVVASGEIYVMGGISFTEDPVTGVTVTGYLRLGGMVEVLNLVSVSMEARIQLAYNAKRQALVGSATFVVTVDLTLWSDHMEISTGDWVLAGGSSGSDHSHALMAARPGAPHLGPADAAPPASDGLAQWQLYRNSFDPSPGTTATSQTATEGVSR
jgi:hypothetical protein